MDSYVPPPRTTRTTSGARGHHLSHALDDVLRRPFAFHDHPREKDPRKRVTSAQRAQHIMDGGADRRGDDADAFGTQEASACAPRP